MGRWRIVRVGGGLGGQGSECVRVVRMTNSRNCEYVLKFLDTVSLRYVCSSLYTARIGYEHTCYAEYSKPLTKEDILRAFEAFVTVHIAVWAIYRLLKELDTGECGKRYTRRS